MKDKLLTFLTAVIILGAVLIPIFWPKCPPAPTGPRLGDYIVPSAIGDCRPDKPPCTLRIPPGGKSLPMALYAGHRPKFTSPKSFTYFCYYTDGKELQAPCKDGPIVFLFLVDLSGTGNDVLYEQVPM